MLIKNIFKEYNDYFNFLNLKGEGKHLYKEISYFSFKN